MLSIQKIFGHDQRFFDLLEASAQQADASVHHLIDLLERQGLNKKPRRKAWRNSVEPIIWAWIFTLPATRLLGYVMERAAIAL